MRRPFIRGAVRCALLGASILGLAAPVPVAAAAPAAQSAAVRFDIPVMDLAAALEVFGKQSGKEIIFDRAQAAGKRSTPVSGVYEPRQALSLLLGASGLSMRMANAQTFVVEPVGNGVAADEAATSPASDSIVVTGTRIKGVAPASPLIIVTSQDIHDSGQQSLGEVIRSLPVDYAGGQNPGVRYQTDNLANENTGGGSSINLRGLGADATLTLLNGHRLTYNGSSQAVDISMIPVDAVSSIQIVPDGASAIYGSDAVAGVANIILKRDYSGLTTTARLGGATSGGGFQQAYDAVTGSRWGGGGLLVAYEYGRQKPIRSDQRSYAEYLARPSTLIDAEHHHSILLTAHQDIAPGIALTIDGIYNRRSVAGAQNSSSAYSFEYSNPSTRYAISPTLKASLSSDWTLQINGFAGSDKTTNSVTLNLKPTGTPFYASSIHDKNSSRGAELNVEGGLLRIGGGDVRLALGAGYRKNEFSETFSTIPIAYRGSISSRYGFSEITIPIVSDVNSSEFLHRLTLSGAYRYEHYDVFGNIGTPKLGLVYSPSRDVNLKLSWGKSFKAPTLLQQFKEYQANLYPAASLGGTGLPANATVLAPYGGNPDLKPERAQTWSATVDAHPKQIPGLDFQITYFDVKYRDRVVVPLLPIGAALSNPIFSEFLTYNPTAAQLQAVIDRAPRGLQNYTGSAYDPSNVVAIANDIYINSAAQKIHGIDVFSAYTFEVLGGRANLSAQASWLAGRQQNSPSSPEIILAGTQFNPPHWRGRAGASWTGRQVTVSAFYNYIGPVSDTSSTPAVSGRSMQTVDLNLFLRPAAKVLKGVEIGLIAQNLFNAKPPFLRPANNTLIDYDSTNYSPVGRFLALSVRKAW
jgi:outer membrane receptor protein involved in Fe transport